MKKLFEDMKEYLCNHICLCLGSKGTFFLVRGLAFFAYFWVLIGCFIVLGGFCFDLFVWDFLCMLSFSQSHLFYCIELGTKSSHFLCAVPFQILTDCRDISLLSNNTHRNFFNFFL